MAGVLTSGWKLDFVGTLENAEQDWAKMTAEARLGVKIGPLNESLGLHPSTLDPQGARQSMIGLLRADVNLRHRLCRLLEPDYICFGYEAQSCFNGSALPTAVDES